MLAAPLFALRAAQAGAELRTHAGVTKVDVDADGGTRRFTVQRPAAGQIRAHRIVDAAGAWGERPRGAVRPPPPDPRRGPATST
jgi:glycine/D-amino acid oxidase-like deaminating enzyme